MAKGASLPRTAVQSAEIGLNRERAELYERINRRSAAMVEAGYSMKSEG